MKWLQNLGHPSQNVCALANVFLNVLPRTENSTPDDVISAQNNRTISLFILNITFLLIKPNNALAIFWQPCQHCWLSLKSWLLNFWLVYIQKVVKSDFKKAEIIGFRKKCVKIMWEFLRSRSENRLWVMLMMSLKKRIRGRVTSKMIIDTSVTFPWHHRKESTCKVWITIKAHSPLSIRITMLYLYQNLYF